MSDDSFFEGGDKVRGFSYQGQPPITHSGKVLEIGAPVQARELNYNRQTQQYEQGDPKTWDDGNPIMSRRVVVQTQLREDADDDGRRCWFMEQGKEITKAMMAAVQEVRGKGKSMPAIGSDLSLTFTATDPNSFEGKKKLFTAQYQEDPWAVNAPPVGGGAAMPPPPQYQQQQYGAPPPAPAAYAPPAPSSPGAPWGQQPPAQPAATTPAPQMAPPPAQAAAPAGDPALVAFLQSKQVDINGMNPATMQQVAAYMGYRPAAAPPEPPF